MIKLSNLKIPENAVFDLVDPANYNQQAQAFTFSFQTTNARGTYVKSDGTMFFMGDASNDKVYAYEMSTPYDLSTATHNGDTFAHTSDAYGVTFKPDGSKMYLGELGSTVTEYSLSSAWDITTATASGNSVEMTGGATVSPNFNSSGTVLYTAYTNTNTGKIIVRYRTLSTAWDLGTAGSSSIKELSFETIANSFYIFNNDNNALLTGSVIYSLDFGTPGAANTLVENGYNVSHGYVYSVDIINNYLYYSTGSGINRRTLDSLKNKTTVAG